MGNDLRERRGLSQGKRFWLALAVSAIAPSWAQASLLSLGTGSDGALVVGSTQLVDTVRSSLTDNVVAGGTSLTVGNAAGIAVGDEVLVIAQQGSTGVGQYEFVRVAGVAGSTLTLASPLANAYAGATNRVTVQRVPNYTTVTVQSGGTLTAGAWDGTAGGIVAFRATGAVNVLAGGAISADALGFRGGAPAPSNSSANGRQGESYVGVGVQGQIAANAGAGGAGLFSSTSGDNGYGGGGGGHATPGTNGQNDPLSSGVGGGVYGSPTLSQIFLGSGGGSGGTDDDNPDNAAPYPMAAGGAGGRGGGIVFIAASSLTLTGDGRLSARGQNGFDGVGDPRNGTDPDTGASLNADEPGGGGAGSGGSVFIAYADVGPTLLASSVVGGGVGGTGLQANARLGGNGGEGYLLVTPIPEPASIGAAALLGGLLVVRRRRR